METNYHHDPDYDRWKVGIPYTLPFNLTGQPGASILCGVSPEGLPVGLQVVAARYQDPLVLEVCLAIEQVIGFGPLHPVLRKQLEALEVGMKRSWLMATAALIGVLVWPRAGRRPTSTPCWSPRSCSSTRSRPPPISPAPSATWSTTRCSPWTSKGEIKPQMVQDWSESPDKLTWTFTLRDGLKFHDGAPGDRGRLRGLAAALGAEGRARPHADGGDPARWRRRMRQDLHPHPERAVPADAGGVGQAERAVPFIMPARLATPDQKFTEVDRLGPVHLPRGPVATGDKHGAERNPAYVPRNEPPDFLAGGKKVKIDTLTLKVMPTTSPAPRR